MARLEKDLIVAFCRSFLAEGGNLREGTIVEAGTDVEQQAKACTGNDGLAIGVVVDANVVGKSVSVCEENGLVILTCSAAVSATNLRLYLDSTGQKVTSTKPTVAGTYISIGKSKSITENADEKIAVFIDPQELVVV